MIAHIDADSFFASVLERLDPRLKGKPLLALGMGGGCVIAASYAAKAKGVRTGMRLKDALQLCPHAVCRPSDFNETTIASHQIEAIIQDHCFRVEQMSIDEWFLDITSLVGGVPFDPYLWAKDLQSEILKVTSLSVSIGVAPSKVLAKMAGEYKKPAGVTVIEKRDIEKFLSDRPAAAIPGIGRARQKHSEKRKWVTAWDFANADRCTVVQLFGRPGSDLQRELLGERLSKVQEDTCPPQSISRCRSFRKTARIDQLWAYIMQHLSYTVLKMRKQKLACRGISVWLREGYDSHTGTNLRLPQLSDTEEIIAPFVRTCFMQIQKKGKFYTQAGLCLWGLAPKTATQFSLFQNPHDTMRDESLQKSLDQLRVQYGREVVVRGSALSVNEPHEKHLDFSMPG